MAGVRQASNLRQNEPGISTEVKGEHGIRGCSVLFLVQFLLLSDASGYRRSSRLSTKMDRERCTDVCSGPASPGLKGMIRLRQTQSEFHSSSPAPQPETTAFSKNPFDMSTGPRPHNLIQSIARNDVICRRFILERNDVSRYVTVPQTRLGGVCAVLYVGCADVV